PLHNTSRPRDYEPDAVGLEKLRKWQEARIERKLRGEYESILLRLSELVGCHDLFATLYLTLFEIQSNKDTPMRITSLRLDGAETTRPSFLHWLIEPHLARASNDGATVDDVLNTTKRITNKLLETEAFLYVLPRLERSKDVLAQPGDVELVVQ